MIIDHESPEEGGNTTPTISLPGNILPSRAGIEDIFDLLHGLAVGPLHHHYAAVSAFCVNRFKLRNITFRNKTFKTHNFLSLTFHLLP